MAKSVRIRKIQLAGYGAGVRRARIAMAIATAGSVLGRSRSEGKSRGESR